MTRICTTIPQTSYRSASSRGTEENPNWTPKTWHSGTAGGEICGSFRVTDDHAHDVRICPGLLVAESTLFITVATMLSVFKFSPVEENGKFVMPPVQQTDGLIRYAPTPHLSMVSDCCSIRASHPAPFQCSIKSRSAHAESLVRSAVEMR